MKTILKRNLLLTLILVSLSALLGGCVDKEKQDAERIAMQTRVWNVERFIDTVSWLKYGSKFPTIPDGARCSVLESNDDLTKYKIWLEYDYYANVCVKRGIVVSVWKNK